MVTTLNSIAALATAIKTNIPHKLESHMEFKLDFPFKAIDFFYQDDEKNVSWLFWEGAMARTLLEKVDDEVFDYNFYLRFSHPKDECYMLTTPRDRLSPPRIYSPKDPKFVKCPRIIHPINSNLDMKLDTWLSKGKKETDPLAYGISRTLILSYEGSKKASLLEEINDWVESSRHIFHLYQKLGEHK